MSVKLTLKFCPSVTGIGETVTPLDTEQWPEVGVADAVKLLGLTPESTVSKSNQSPPATFPLMMALYVPAGEVL